MQNIILDVVRIDFVFPRNLVQQLKKLQALVLSKTSKPQASTCLVVLVMSFAFLIVPNIDPFGIKRDKLSDPTSVPIRGKILSCF
jgi:hypothetical protein